MGKDAYKLSMNQITLPTWLDQVEHWEKDSELSNVRKDKEWDYFLFCYLRLLADTIIFA